MFCLFWINGALGDRLAGSKFLSYCILDIFASKNWQAIFKQYIGVSLVSGSHGYLFYLYSGHYAYTSM